MAEREPFLLRCALRIAADGMPVFPLRPHTKVPAIERWPQHASTDPDTDPSVVDAVGVQHRHRHRQSDRNRGHRPGRGEGAGRTSRATVARRAGSRSR